MTSYINCGHSVESRYGLRTGSPAKGSAYRRIRIHTETANALGYNFFQDADMHGDKEKISAS